ncbi:NTP transferase domain-containing protein, partial [Aeromonas caviae]|uniref:NTP transferase domain-containing protein n=1 Tax=Aeromonas caviae TaxID=648 RepID=UPI0025B63225
MTPSSSPAFLVSGVILAGGRATRMGGDDKGWVPLAGTPLIEHVLTRLRPQVNEVLINANRSQARSVSYTLLTLPTNPRAEYSLVAGTSHTTTQRI